MKKKILLLAMLVAIPALAQDYERCPRDIQARPQAGYWVQDYHGCWHFQPCKYYQRRCPICGKMLTPWNKHYHYQGEWKKPVYLPSSKCPPPPMPKPHWEDHESHYPMPLPPPPPLSPKPKVKISIEVNKRGNRARFEANEDEE